MKVYCEGRRSYNTSFKIDIHVTHSETSRFTAIRKALLQPGTEFTVYVTASTRKGEGAQSESVVVNTPSTGETLFVDLFNCIFTKSWKSFKKLRQTRVTCMHHSIPPVEKRYFVTPPRFYHTFKQNRHPLRGLLPKKKVSTCNLRNQTSQYPKVNTDRFKNSYVNRLIFKYNLAM